MENHTMHSIRFSPLRTGIAKWLARRRAAFKVLRPQVEIGKRSTTVQLATGSAIVGSLLTGQLSLAATLAAAWLGSRPLTHVAAGGVACVGTLDDALRAAIARLQTRTLNAKGNERPSAE